MVKAVRVQVIPGDPVRLDVAVGPPSHGRNKTVSLYNSGTAVVGLGGRDITLEQCYRGFTPGTTVIVELGGGEGIYAVVGEGCFGEVDVFRVG